MPPEVDAEEVIKAYWGGRSRELGFANEEELDRWVDGALSKFIDATAETPVPLVEFVRWLDTGPFVELLRGAYKDFERVRKELEARMRFFAYFVLSEETHLTKAYRRLSEADCQALGFDMKPTYELVREFVYELIGRERFGALFERAVGEVRIQLKRRGIVLGQRTSQDATDLPSLKHDPEAEYSGYYKEYGYKADVTIDLDHLMPLHYAMMGINESEERCLIETKEHLAERDIRPTEHKVDGKYASFQNIAHAETHETHLVYAVQQGWVAKPEVDEAAIQRKYQQYHTCPGFRIGASLGFMLRYLQEKGEDKLVGNFYRNKVMALEGEALEAHGASYKERGVKMEGFIGTAKCHTTLGKRPTKRGKEAMRFILDLSMLSFVFAALIRVQNGVYANLASLGHFG